MDNPTPHTGRALAQAKISEALTKGMAASQVPMGERSEGDWLWIKAMIAYGKDQDKKNETPRPRRGSAIANSLRTKAKPYTENFFESLRSNQYDLSADDLLSQVRSAAGSAKDLFQPVIDTVSGGVNAGVDAIRGRMASQEFADPFMIPQELIPPPGENAGRGPPMPGGGGFNFADARAGQPPGGPGDPGRGPPMPGGDPTGGMPPPPPGGPDMLSPGGPGMMSPGGPGGGEMPPPPEGRGPPMPGGPMQPPPGGPNGPTEPLPSLAERLERMRAGGYPNAEGGSPYGGEFFAEARAGQPGGDPTAPVPPQEPPGRGPPMPMVKPNPAPPRPGIPINQPGGMGNPEWGPPGGEAPPPPQQPPPMPGIAGGNPEWGPNAGAMREPPMPNPFITAEPEKEKGRGLFGMGRDASLALMGAGGAMMQEGGRPGSTFGTSLGAGAQRLSSNLQVQNRNKILDKRADDAIKERAEDRLAVLEQNRLNARDRRADRAVGRAETMRSNLADENQKQQLTELRALIAAMNQDKAGAAQRLAEDELQQDTDEHFFAVFESMTERMTQGEVSGTTIPLTAEMERKAESDAARLVPDSRPAKRILRRDKTLKVGEARSLHKGQLAKIKDSLEAGDIEPLRAKEQRAQADQLLKAALEEINGGA